MPDGPADYGGVVEAAVVAEDVDVLIVHIVGHGELAEDRSEKLYVLDSDGERLSRPVGGWIDLIEDHPKRHRPLTLFVLDVCNAGEAAVTAWHARMEVGQRRAWVLAATGPNERAFDYRLSKALVQVLEKYLDRGSRFDPSVRYIPPPTVWRDVERAVKELAEQADGLEQKIQTSRVPAHEDLSQLPFFPNPSYAPGKGLFGRLAGLPPEIARLADWAGDPQHFIQRASGAEPVDRHWAPGYFSGRTAQLDTLARWLDEERAGPGVRVVTGKPGAGKSALLGVLVCAAHPALRQPTESLWTRLDDAAPGKNDRIAVLHARRLSLSDVVTSLARQLRHIHDPGGRPDPGDTRTETTEKPGDYLMGLLPDDGRPVTVVIDALDEALQPRDITTELLLPLARQAQRPGSPLRLLVGTRDDERFHALLALARDAGGCTDLSTIAPDSVRRDVTSYLKRVLAPDGPYAGATQRPLRDALAEAIAETLTEQGQNGGPAQDPLQWGEFLTAGLYAHYLLQTPAPSTPQEAARQGRAVPRSLPKVLELDLQRHTAQPLLRPVLTALAFAQGRGIPESLLAHAAAAFTPPSSSAHPLPLPDLYALLDGEARFYLRRDVDDDGTTLYRLFHEGLADWLVNLENPPPGPIVPATDAPPRNPAERLYERLLECLPRDTEGRAQWHLAVPYMLRHAAQHAVNAGRLDELLQDGGYLQHADPHTLPDALQYARSEQARINAAVYRSSWDVHHTLPPAARRQILALDGARFRNPLLQAQLPGDTDWHVRWTTGSQVSAALVRTLTSRSRGVLAMAVVELGRRPHAVTGGDGGSVRVWDLTTGIQTRELIGHTGRVVAVATVQLDGRPHAVTGSGGDGSVRVWDLATGTQTGVLPGVGGVVALAVVELEGRPLVVTGSEDGSARVWDPATSLPTGEFIDRTSIGKLKRNLRTGESEIKASLHALAAVELDGRPHVIGGGYSSPAWVWDLTRGTQPYLLPGDRSLRAVVAVELDGRPHAITSGFDESVRVWDLTGGIQTCVLPDTGRVAALVAVELDGRPHVVTGGEDGSVRVWDLTTNASTCVLTGHTAWVEVLVAVELDGRPDVVSGCMDGSLRVWDPTIGALTGELTAPTGKVWGMTAVELEGRSHAVVADDQGAVRVWDVTTGGLVRVLPGIQGVKVVAVEELWGCPHLVTAGISGMVRVWNLATGTQIRALTDTIMANAMAVVELRGRPHAVAGGFSEPVQLWDLTTGTPIRELPGPTEAVAVFELEGRPHVLIADPYGSASLCDLTTGTQVRVLPGTGRVSAMAVFELAGRPHAIICSVVALAQVWDLTTGLQARILPGTEGVFAVAVFELGGRPHAITGGIDKLVRVWDLTTGALRTTFHCPAAVLAVAVTPDADVIVGFGDEVAVLSLAPLKGKLS
ncbi:AAA family ATPase [Streptomyces sp. AC550_RSS872]|uniref:NACHT and WD repeat domain-containing protein n=1 Tax=Streptomyces sp. AC550_RSS872 TaxID=2823689 RepID=UPI001C2570AC|nr:AAA family ATPase [Streptomyces sp. AC550_RSS872]